MFMIVAGSVITLLGLGFVFNVLRSADRFAAFSRPFPWFLKGLLADYPIAYRLLGAAYVVMGVAFIIVGVQSPSMRAGFYPQDRFLFRTTAQAVIEFPQRGRG